MLWTIQLASLALTGSPDNPALTGQFPVTLLHDRLLEASCRLPGFVSIYAGVVLIYHCIMLLSIAFMLSIAF